MWRALASLPLGALLVASSACTDECRQLADVVCDCEPTQPERRACRTQLETQQQNRDAPTPEEIAACQVALEECSCEALEEERTDLCGFTRDHGIDEAAPEQ